MSGSAPRAGAHLTRPVVAVTPDTDFATVVAALTAARRGVLPVVNGDGAVVGVVSASDLLAAYDRADGTPGPTARDLMTSPAVTVPEAAEPLAAARTALRAGVHHLPVLDADGHLVDLLSPHDLLDALRAADEAIRERALALALTPGSGVLPGALRVRCERGVVVLSGRTRTRADAQALGRAVAGIDGVTGVAAERLRGDRDGPDGVS
ncbi:CBS domain-containing protein [Kitasatospora cineracea]